jgi:hypothetical protein
VNFSLRALGPNLENSRIAGGWLLWTLAWLPAVAILFWIESFQIRLPYHDSWAFVGQYQDWVEGRYTWGDFFATHNGHPSLPGKLLYFVVLHWMGGDMSHLNWLSWFFSLTISISLFLVARPLWRGASPWVGPALMFFGNLSIFTGAQGHTWVWDFVFQNYIAGACLMAALALLRAGVAWRPWRGIVAFVLAAGATFSFGSGFLVGGLLLPVLWAALPDGYSRGQKIKVVALWAVAAAVVTWLALAAVPAGAAGADPGGRLEGVYTRPGMALQYVLILLGHTLGQGTVVEAVIVCAGVGGILVFLLLSAMVRLGLKCRSQEEWRTVLPWIACCGWAIGNALMICVIRMGGLLESALAPRYATFMQFMLLGVVFLGVAFYRHTGLRALLPSCLRHPGIPIAALAVLFTLHGSAWGAGWHSLRVYHQRMISEVAATDFALVLPLNREIQWELGEGQVVGWLKFLHAQGRLKGVKFVQDTRISSFRQGPPLLDKFASFDLARNASDGTWVASGTCALSKDRVRLADIVLLTVATATTEERVFDFSPPRIPDDFHQRMLLRREFPRHYLGWEHVVDPARLPSGEALTIRAYAYDGHSRRIRSIAGTYQITLP